MTARRLVALYPDHHSRALQFSRNTHERAVRNGDPAIIWASLLDWARARQQAGLREEALKTLRALRGSLTPGRTHPRSRLAMAKLLRNLGEAGQAVSELNQALEKHPDQEFTPEEAALQRAWTGTLSQLRGLALLELERSEEALDAFTVAAEAFAEQHDQVGEAQALASPTSWHG